MPKSARERAEAELARDARLLRGWQRDEYHRAVHEAGAKPAMARRLRREVARRAAVQDRKWRG